MTAFCKKQTNKQANKQTNKNRPSRSFVPVSVVPNGEFSYISCRSAEPYYYHFIHWQMIYEINQLSLLIIKAVSSSKSFIIPRKYVVSAGSIAFMEARQT